MSRNTAGARHCADVAGAFAGEDYAPATRSKPEPMPLLEAAAEHERLLQEHKAGAPLSIGPFLMMLRDALYNDD